MSTNEVMKQFKDQFDNLVTELFTHMCHKHSSMEESNYKIQSIINFLLALPCGQTIIPPQTDQLQLRDFIFFINNWFQRYYYECEFDDELPQVRNFVTF